MGRPYHEMWNGELSRSVEAEVSRSTLTAICLNGPCHASVRFTRSAIRAYPTARLHCPLCQDPVKSRSFVIDIEGSWDGPVPTDRAVAHCGCPDYSTRVFERHVFLVLIYRVGLMHERNLFTPKPLSAKG